MFVRCDVEKFIMGVFAFGAVLSLGAAATEVLSFRPYEKTTHVMQLLTLPLLEIFIYRQLITWYRFRGICSYVFGRKEWGVMDRVGTDREDT